MSKFTLNVRHRPSPDDSMESRLRDFVSAISTIPLPWGLVGNNLELPSIGTSLAAYIKLRGKLGRGISGDLTLRLRSSGNLSDHSSADDSLVLTFPETVCSWQDLANVALPAYVRAMNAYIAGLDRWEEMANKHDLLRESHRGGKNMDGRDGPYYFGPLTYMDRRLCERSCNGMSPEQIIHRLVDLLPEVRSLNDGILIIAADHFPEQAEIVATDLAIRERLGLPR